MNSKQKKLLLDANQDIRSASQRIREAIYANQIDVVETILISLVGTNNAFLTLVQNVRQESTTTEKEGN